MRHLRVHTVTPANPLLPVQSPDSGHTEFRNRRMFGSLDGLRALSVIAVIWHHTTGPHASSLLASGPHGVTLFFAISGFLIVTLLLRERDRTGRIDLKAFYIRRSLRIFPLYYAVIVIYTLLVLVIERNNPVGREFFNNLPFFLTYTSNWFVLLEGRVIFYFAWSLAAEEQFYLVWPTVQKFLTPKRAIMVVVAIIFGVTATQLLSHGDLRDATGLHRIVIGVPLAICFGVVLAHAMHYQRGFNALRWAFASRWSSLVWLVVLLASLNWRAAPDVLIHAAAAMFVGACVYREDHWLASILHLRSFVHEGAVSYGIYLLHMLVKNTILKLAGVVRVEVPTYGVFALTVAGSIIVATLSFRYFESVFLRMKHRHVVA